MASKKVVYVVGCGRSGSTILGFVLGNCARAMDLGDVRQFARLRGRPNDFAVGTANYAFWDAVLRDVTSQLGGIDFVRLAGLQSAVDRHQSFVPLALLDHLYRRDAVSAYRRFIRVLYDRLQREPGFDVVIDTSKYPSYLLHLRRSLDDDRVHVIHLIRNPIDLARAMQRPEQSVPRSFSAAVLYYFVINVFALIATRKLGAQRYLRLCYEDLVSEPEKTLERIGGTFSIDTVPAIDKIRRNQPLERGYVLNGNRMRMQERVTLRTSSGVLPRRSSIERAIERLARLAFGPTAAPRG